MNEAKREREALDTWGVFLLMTGAAGPKLPPRCFHRFGSSRVGYVCVVGVVLEETPLEMSLINKPR